MGLNEPTQQMTCGFAGLSWSTNVRETERGRCIYHMAKTLIIQRLRLFYLARLYEVS